MTDAVSQKMAARLLEAAVELALQRGVERLTARTLATAAGSSPSALNYYFGGRDALLHAVHETLCARTGARRARRLAALADCYGGSTAMQIVAFLVDEACHHRREHLAILEFEALAGSEPALGAAVREEMRRRLAFWREAAGPGAGAAAEIWALVALTLSRLAVLDEDATEAALWIGAVLQRLADRLEGASRPGEIVWLSSGLAPAPAKRPEGAQRLIRAALHLIGERGLEALTLRSIAAEAGLSLASTTYFFRSKAEIVQSAFEQLRYGLSMEALKDGPAQSANFTGAVLRPRGTERREVSALQELYLAGARDADLRPVALGLRGLAGSTSMAWLASVSPLRCDRLDAFLWSSFMTGAQEMGRLVDAEGGRQALEATIQSAAERLFQIPGST